MCCYGTSRVVGQGAQAMVVKGEGFCTNKTVFKIVLFVGLLLGVLSALAMTGILHPQLSIPSYAAKYATWIATQVSADAFAFTSFVTSIGGTMILIGIIGWTHACCPPAENEEETGQRAPSSESKASAESSSPPPLSESEAKLNLLTTTLTRLEVRVKRLEEQPSRGLFPVREGGRGRTRYE